MKMLTYIQVVYDVRVNNILPVAVHSKSSNKSRGVRIVRSQIRMRLGKLDTLQSIGTKISVSVHEYLVVSDILLWFIFSELKLSLVSSCLHQTLGE